MEKDIFDYVPVLMGLLVMVAYQSWLLRQIIRRPSTTVIGINAFSRRLSITECNANLNGRVEEIGGLSSYTTGLADSKAAVIMASDVFGYKVPHLRPKMGREKEIPDYILVPLVLLVMVAYHLWLLRQIIRRPSTTVIGINAFNRRLWVHTMMENGILAVQALRNNIMASTTIMLSSIIAVKGLDSRRPNATEQHILIWMCLVQLVAVGKLWHPRLLTYWIYGLKENVGPSRTIVAYFPFDPCE